MMTEQWSAKADALLAALKTKINHNNDAVALDFLSCTTIDSLAEMMGEEFAGLARDEQHSIVATLIAKYGPGDGIEFKSATEGGTPPVWIRVTPALPGRLPSQDPSERRWIRLDTITAVIPKRSTALNSDPQDWLSSLEVESNGEKYHASAVRFRGLAVDAAIDKVLDAVSRLVLL